MKKYDKAQICANGHYISVTKKGFVTDKHCSQCGMAIFDKCLHCGEPFRGVYSVDGGGRCLPPKPDSFCYNCGMPYPWIEQLKNAVINAAELEKQIKPNELKLLEKHILDLTNENPNTQNAIMMIERFLLKNLSSNFTASLSNFIFKAGCETAKMAFNYLLPPK